MKISDRNTCLHLLTDPIPVSYAIYPPIGPDGEMEPPGPWPFQELRPLFTRRIQYLTHPFMDAFKKARPYLENMPINDPPRNSGTLIFSFGPMQVTVFYEYSIEINGPGPWPVNHTIACFTCRPADGATILLTVLRQTATDQFYYMDRVWGGAGMTPGIMRAQVFTIILFLKYAEHQTKIIPAGKKVRHSSQKYVNETHSTIEMVDTTWYTTTVRTEGFMVGARTGGFPRWQVYGPEKSERKLIWVPPFEKHGYTRKAKMLGDNNNPTP